MGEHGTDSGKYAWGNPWFRWSVGSLIALALVSMLVGFVVLPSVHQDFTAQGLWAAICRAAGVPASWSAGASAKAAPLSTSVVLEPAMGRPGKSEAVGRGGTLALNCTMCHGAQGMSLSNSPNLAGQYPEVVIKQLYDYKGGKRTSPIMEPLARNLSDRDILDLAAYYATLK